MTVYDKNFRLFMKLFFFFFNTAVPVARSQIRAAAGATAIAGSELHLWPILQFAPLSDP